MEINIKKSEAVRQMDTNEVTIGQTTYVVRTNTKSVPKAFVKKTVQKLLFDTLKQKVRKPMDNPLSPCYNKNKVWNCVLFKRREEENYELEQRNNRKQWSNCSLLPFKL